MPAFDTGGSEGRVRSNEPIPSFVTRNPGSEASRAIIRLVDDIATGSNRAEGTAVLVTASAPNEGKTTIAVNLALAAARSGDRVLLIDGDLESRTLSEAIDASNHGGLSDVIAGRAEPTDVILAIPAIGVDLLPAGQSAVRLTGHANRLIEAAMHETMAPYDVVIIDGGLLPHGRLLSAWSSVAVDTVMVARSGTSRKDKVAAAYEGAKATGNSRMRTLLVG
jgi:Mrp family chromosome partitioning ATPase